MVKKLLKYTLILFGIAVMICCIGFVIMFFGVPLFGYKYANFENNNNIVTIDNISKLSDSESLKTIDLTTTNTSVAVDYTDGDTLFVNIIKKYKGVVKESRSTLSYFDPSLLDENGVIKKDADGNELVSGDPKSFVKIVNGVLKVMTLDPEGFFFQNGNVLKIILPKSCTTQNINIKTASNNISMGEITINDFSLESTNPSLLNNSINLSENMVINGNLGLTTICGRVIINSEVKGNVTIESKSGSFVFNKSVGSSTSQFVVKGSSPAIYIGELTNDMKKKAQDKLLKYTIENPINILGSLSIEKDSSALIRVSGSISGTVGMLSKNASLWASDIDGLVTMSEGCTDFVVLNNLAYANKCSLTAGNGSIYIKNCFSDIDITATGNEASVEIRNALSNVKVSGGKAPVSINFSTFISGKTLDISNNGGDITATNINGVAKIVGGYGKVYAKFLNVVGESSVSGFYGVVVEIKDDSTKQYLLNLTRTDSVSNPNIHLGSVIINKWESNSISMVINKTSETQITADNKLSVHSNSGDITMSDFVVE